MYHLFKKRKRIVLRQTKLEFGTFLGEQHLLVLTLNYTAVMFKL